MNRPLGFILVLILATVVGCGGQVAQPKYANVKGKVTYNGKPIDKGQITFSVDGQPPSSMNIVDGDFSGQAMVGSNRVSVDAWKRGATAPKLSEHAQIQMEGYLKKFKNSQEKGATEHDANLVNYIPPEWGAKSKETRVVEAGAANDFEFHIKGKN